MSAPAPATTPRARQILLVDDDTAFSGFFKDFLLMQGPGQWIVHTADHYAPALTCIKENAVDLVVLDLKMPVMDGMQLLALLQRTHPELPVVMLTSAASPETRAQCLQKGATLFFDKTEIADGLEKIYTALETVATAPKQGFRGMLQQVGLSDVLQMECLGRKSSILEVRGHGAAGQIYIQDGSIIHAEFGGQQGEPALFQLLGLEGGEFQLKPFVTTGRQTIDGHWESLLMEAARLRDEAQGSEGVTGAGAVAAEAKPVAEPPRQTEEIVLCSYAGELLYQWESPQVERRIALLDVLARISDSLAGSLAMPRGGRLEVETRAERAVIILQPDRRVFIRSANPGGVPQ